MNHSNLRHVDVAILYGQDQKDRAQYVARKLRLTDCSAVVTEQKIRKGIEARRRAERRSRRQNDA